MKRTPEQLKRHREYERARYQAMTPEQRRELNAKKLRAKAAKFDAYKFESWQVLVALKAVNREL